MTRFAALLFALALPAAAQARQQYGQPLVQRFNAEASPHYFQTQEGGAF